MNLKFYLKNLSLIPFTLMICWSYCFLFYHFFYNVIQHMLVHSWLDFIYLLTKFQINQVSFPLINQKVKIKNNTLIHVYFLFYHSNIPLMYKKIIHVHTQHNLKSDYIMFRYNKCWNKRERSLDTISVTLSISDYIMF